ncbi:MAG: hypothetical protein KIH69_005655 [Anaerolineae bacterium]|nr:hypothetical protein [Anaerolineae bacterium]
MSDETVQLTPRYTAAEFRERGETLRQIQNETFPIGRRYSSAVFAERGDLFFRQLMPTFSKAEYGKYIAIDIESGEFEIDEDDFAATERLLNRIPTAQTWMGCIGFPTAYRIGFSPRGNLNDSR